MATQTVAGLVNQSSRTRTERLQPSAKLRTFTPSRENPNSEINDSERVVRICTAVNEVLDFMRTARLADSGVAISNWTKHLEAGVTLQSAAEELEHLKEHIYKENLVLRDEVDRASMFEEIVGTSRALQAVLSRIAKVAPTDSTTLITGETGTGKELVARAIHRRSRRSARAFVSVNCAAVPRELIAS